MYRTTNLMLHVVSQVKARIDAIQQRLQSDPNFRKAYPKQVAKEIHQEQLLEAQLAKQVSGRGGQ